VILADTQAIAFMARVEPSTVRSWACRGLIKRRGTGRRGIALYAVEDAEALIDKRRHEVQRSEGCRTSVP
jgi:DNA-binding transcriptional MerR regulator